MKKTFYLILNLIFILSFSNCSTNSSDTEETQKNVQNLNYSKTTNNYPFNLHNSSLAAFIEDADINHNDYNSSNEPSEMMFDFLEGYMKDNMSLEGVDEEWISIFYRDFRAFEPQTNSQFVDIVNGYYYNKIMEILDEGSSYSIVNEKLDSLSGSLDRDNTISESNKSIIKYSIAIGKESYEYWEKNDSKWSEVASNYYTSNMTAKKDRGKMAQADVTSAVTGAITGAFTGGPFGALAGATLGAAWGSAAEAASQHFGWSWSWD